MDDSVSIFVSEPLLVELGTSFAPVVSVLFADDAISLSGADRVQPFVACAFDGLERYRSLADGALEGVALDWGPSALVEPCSQSISETRGSDCR